MPRTSRKEIVASYIHVITQGINKENIFKNSEYKTIYINLIKEKFEKYDDLQLLCYCIMDNHAHFLIYTQNNSSLSKAMSSINTSYGIFYNKKENRVGYVFRNRYYTQAIKDEGHLHNAVVYIHRNPVKAKIVEKMEEYKYSSYCQYEIGNVEAGCAQLLFQTQDYKEMFCYIHRNFKDEGDIADIRELEKNPKEIEEFLEKYYKNTGISKDKIKKSDSFMIPIVKKLKNEYYCTNKEISEMLGIGKNRVTRIIKK